jgi:hypothetical protein
MGADRTGGNMRRYWGPMATDLTAMKLRFIKTRHLASLARKSTAVSYISLFANG